MNERIKAHLDSLFAGAPRTRRVEETYQELLAGCLDKYADLTQSGMDEEEAYQKVIDGIGDVGELLGYIEQASAFDPRYAEEQRRRRAFFTSAGICGYFIAVALFFWCAYSGMPMIGLVELVILAGISTTLIVYGRLSAGTDYQKADDTLVEEMKMQMMTADSKEKKLASLVASTLWSLVVVVYLAASFLTGRWDITWMVFPLAGGLQCLVVAYFNPAQREKNLTGAFWSLATTLYLVISFWTFAWHITWLIFPAAAAIHQAARLFMYWRETL